MSAPDRLPWIRTVLCGVDVGREQAPRSSGSSVTEIGAGTRHLARIIRGARGAHAELVLMSDTLLVLVSDTLLSWEVYLK